GNELDEFERDRRAAPVVRNWMTWKTGEKIANRMPCVDVRFPVHARNKKGNSRFHRGTARIRTSPDVTQNATTITSGDADGPACQLRRTLTGLAPPAWVRCSKPHRCWLLAYCRSQRPIEEGPIDKRG